MRKYAAIAAIATTAMIIPVNKPFPDLVSS